MALVPKKPVVRVIDGVRYDTGLFDLVHTTHPDKETLRRLYRSKHSKYFLLDQRLYLIKEIDKSVSADVIIPMSLEEAHCWMKVKCPERISTLIAEDDAYMRRVLSAAKAKASMGDTERKLAMLEEVLNGMSYADVARAYGSTATRIKTYAHHFGRHVWQQWLKNKADVASKPPEFNGTGGMGNLTYMRLHKTYWLQQIAVFKTQWTLKQGE